jgi:sirohydrochlorin cobaltochelatase
MTRPADASRRGVILFAHGSRDPLWRQPMEAVAARVRARAPDLDVACAYLELNEPDLPSAVALMAAAGIRAVAVVPMFLGTGKHAREDLPLLMARLREQHPDTDFVLQQAVGEDARVLDLLAAIALE